MLKKLYFKATSRHTNNRLNGLPGAGSTNAPQQIENSSPIQGNVTCNTLAQCKKRVQQRAYSKYESSLSVEDKRTSLSIFKNPNVIVIQTCLEMNEDYEGRFNSGVCARMRSNQVFKN